MSTAAFGRVAIVHDWLTGMRGGERVLETLVRHLGEVEVFTLFHQPGSVAPTIEAVPIHTSFLNRLPAIRRFYRLYLPLYERAVECWDFAGFDRVVSISHCVAHGAVVAPDVPHVCYCLTPVRYAWDQGPTYFAEIAPPRIARMLPALLSGMRAWDVGASHRVDRYVAISAHVARRILRFYRRRATVVHPPVDTDFFSPGGQREGYFLLVSALVPQKGIRLAIETFNRLQRPLLIVGKGPLRRRLEALAGQTVRFLGWQSDVALRRLYRQCRAVVFPGEEDFGIVPLEAQACGRPVIALARGGALETIRESETGLFFPEPTVESLTTAIRRLDCAQFDVDACRAHAELFSVARFLAAFDRAVLDSGGEAPPDHGARTCTAPASDVDPVPD
ncbi:MAG: glycosyltransferase [Candidatus Schekmanbacteria bacterium]|nr:glycosyltransferase [Candidatus Schekmanbacteria bacterium]